MQLCLRGNTGDFNENNHIISTNQQARTQLIKLRFEWNAATRHFLTSPFGGCCGRQSALPSACIITSWAQSGTRWYFFAYCCMKSDILHNSGHVFARLSGNLHSWHLNNANNQRIRTGVFPFNSIKRASCNPSFWALKDPFFAAIVKLLGTKNNPTPAQRSVQVSIWIWWTAV